MASGARGRVCDPGRCDKSGGPRAADARVHRCAGHPLLAMSLILDALRRGRGKQTPQLNSNAAQAQTDALLHTLGYGPFNTTSSFNRVKRIVAYLALTVLFAIVLWGAVIWITLTYFGSTAVDESTMVLQEAPTTAPNPMPAPPRGAAQPEPAPPVTTTPSVTTARPVTEPSVTMAPAPLASARSGGSAAG